MGILICEEHGRQFFHEICEHCDSDFKNGILSKTHTIEILNLKLCQSCFEIHSFQEIEKLRVEDISNNFISDEMEEVISEKYDIINRKIVCAKCYSNLKNILGSKT